MNESWATDTCTLPTADRPLREAEFDVLFTESLRRVKQLSATHVRLSLDASAEELAKDLARRETECCSFFRFSFAPVEDGSIAVDIEVPPPYADVLAALADRASGAAGLPA